MGLGLMVTDEGTLDQAPSTKIIAIEGVGYFDVRIISSTVDPGIDLWPRQENQQELDGSVQVFLRENDEMGKICSWRE